MLYVLGLLYAALILTYHAWAVLAARDLRRVGLDLKADPYTQALSRFDVLYQEIVVGLLGVGAVMFGASCALALAGKNAPITLMVNAICILWMALKWRKPPVPDDEIALCDLISAMRLYLLEVAEASPHAILFLAHADKLHNAAFICWVGVTLAFAWQNITVTLTII